MEKITIEVRSRLRSCNIFISTKDTLEKNSVQLKLNESLMSLRIGDRVNNLPLKSMKIIPKTLSSLTVASNWISLRVQTQPIEASYGSFKTELVGAPSRESSPKPNDVEFCPKDKDCVLVCSRCKKELTQVVSFSRILPLPTNDYDPSEWFCCKHEGEDYATIPDPKESDCFFERDYRLFNKAIFKGEVKVDGDSETVACDRCLSVLGARSTLFKNSVRVWNCCVDYRFLGDSLGVYEASDPLKDFSLIVRDRTDIFTGNRLLVEAADAGRSHYLLVQLMDKNLEILIEKDRSVLNTDDAVELTSSRVTKVLYKYAENEAEIKSCCVDVERCLVALPVMLAAMEHLLLTTERYPPSYRIVDKYYVGYIYL